MTHHFESFHGIVFSRLLHGISTDGVFLNTYPTEDNASYVINNKIGIYIKYSKRRISPWRFSFKKRHQSEILEMHRQLGHVFLLLVCHDDGIVTLSFEEIKQILDENYIEGEWISVSRNKRQMYSVKGSDGQLKLKVAREEFPQKLFDHQKSKFKISSFF